MDKLNEIKEKLNAIHEEYKTNKFQLNKDKTKTAAKLIVEMTFSNNVSPSDVAFELSRFSADVVKTYFDYLTESAIISAETLDEVLKEFLSACKITNNNITKFIFVIKSIIKNYKGNVSELKQLPRLVASVAKLAVKSDKCRNKFQALINNTDGEIFMLDYSDINKNSLVNIWNTINNIFPDLSSAKYESFITEWGVKYGFLHGDKVNTSDTGSIEKQTEKQVKSTEEKTDVISSGEIIAEKLYNSLKTDIDREQDAIITAFSDMFTPIHKIFETIQGEIDKSHETGIENLSLKAKITELENQLSEQKNASQEINQSLIAVRTENEELKKKVDSLENQTSQLNSKLDDAYKINSRESSLEAERIRSELKKAFTFLYDDWLEYEFSEVNEDNYESLQAIIKKIFRSLERNGIDFKGNDK